MTVTPIMARDPWVIEYEENEHLFLSPGLKDKTMSRSNPTEGSKNPSTRWFEWAGGSEGGFIRWYNKDTEKHEQVNGPFTFLLLDELATIKGWHEPSESGIFANEVRDTRADVFVVRSFKGGELASGLYPQIRDRVIALGGHYSVSIYLAYKEEDELKIGNLQLKGAAAGAWMDFKRNCESKKDANGKSVRAYFVDAVTIAGYEQMKKGGTIYRVPKFSLKTVTTETNNQALALDAELQAYLAEYLKRPKTEVAKPSEGAAPNYESPTDAPTPIGEPGNRFDDFEDDLPF